MTARLADLTQEAWDGARLLAEGLEQANACATTEEFAICCWKKLLPEMGHLRRCADEMETVTDKKYWPYPSYGEILFSVY